MRDGPDPQPTRSRLGPRGSKVLHERLGGTVLPGEAATAWKGKAHTCMSLHGPVEHNASVFQAVVLTNPKLKHWFLFVFASARSLCLKFLVNSKQSLCSKGLRQ